MEISIYLLGLGTGFLLAWALFRKPHLQYHEQLRQVQTPLTTPELRRRFDAESG